VFKKLKFKIVILFFVYELLFILITSPIYIYKGPFTNLKKIVIGTIMGTQHQYFVTSFLSQDEINKILNTSTLSNHTDKVKLDNIKLDNKKNSPIIRYDIHPDSGRYDGYLLEIPPSYKVKVAYTNKLGIQGERTSQMAKEHNAIAAINGGAFHDNNPNSYGGSAAFAGGFVISDGNVVYKEVGVNDSCSVVAFTKPGKLLVGNYSINDLQKSNVSEALCFGPPTLIINGKGQIDDYDVATSGFNPRTAIGQKTNGTILFLVMDGRKNLVKAGATLKDVQDELLKHGAWNATCLDGGYSSTMYYDGKVINNPHGLTGERYVATALYVSP
jgi:exopolysaccharide biosynthesis protein